MKSLCRGTKGFLKGEEGGKWPPLCTCGRRRVPIDGFHASPPPPPLLLLCLRDRDKKKRSKKNWTGEKDKQKERLLNSGNFDLVAKECLVYFYLAFDTCITEVQKSLSHARTRKTSGWFHSSQ